MILLASRGNPVTTVAAGTVERKWHNEARRHAGEPSAVRQVSYGKACDSNPATGVHPATGISRVTVADSARNPGGVGNARVAGEWDFREGDGKLSGANPALLPSLLFGRGQGTIWTCRPEARRNAAVGWLGRGLSGYVMGNRLDLGGRPSFGLGALFVFATVNHERQPVEN